MAADETYNGWKNYPTWCVNLWLSNDEGTYGAALAIVGDAIAEAKESLSEPETWKRVSPRVLVADSLKEWVRDDLESDLGATMAADLLGYALDCVDWYEIADGWIEAVSEVV